MRNPNGFGCVFKLNGRRRKPYAARITVGWTDEGKQIYKNLGTYSSYKEAMQVLNDYNSNPYDIDASKITFAEIYKKWSSTKFIKLSKSMIAGYKNAYESCKELHDVPFVLIRKFHIQELIDKSNKTYSGREKIKMLTSQLFEYGMENDIVNKNYSNYLDLGEKPDKSLIRIPFSIEEITKLYSSLHIYRYIDTILMMIFTGVRPSELLLLKTNDVFLDDNYFVCGIKTASSKNRKVPISRFVRPFFEKYYSEAIKNNSEFLITNTEGYNMKYSNYNRDKFHRIMEQLEMSHMPHDGRHTFATYMSKCKADKLCTQLIMGHSPKVLIDKTYVHKNIDDLQLEINKLEELLDYNKMISLIDKKYFTNDYQFLTFNSKENLLSQRCS